MPESKVSSDIKGVEIDVRGWTSSDWCLREIL